MASKQRQREEARQEREEREAAELKKQRRGRRIKMLAAAAAVAAVVVVVAVLISSSGGGSSQHKGGSPKGEAEGSAETETLLGGIPQAGVTLGDPKAPVTIYEYADLQCPFCRDYTLTTFPKIVNQYVRNAKVKMVWQTMTILGPDSVTAGQAALAAGDQGKLWNFVDVWYKNQGPENGGYVNDEFIKKIASGVPLLDVARLMADREAPLVQQQLGDAQSAASKFGVDSTPTFFIQKGSGKPTQIESHPGFPLSDFSGPIDKALGGGGA